MSICDSCRFDCRFVIVDSFVDSCFAVSYFFSFSAVSAPILASKYASFSIFENLQDCLADILKSGRSSHILQHLQHHVRLNFINNVIADVQIVFCKLLILERCKRVQQCLNALHILQILKHDAKRTFSCKNRRLPAHQPLSADNPKFWAIVFKMK